MGRSDRDRPFVAKAPENRFVGLYSPRRLSGIPRSTSNSSVSTTKSDSTCKTTSSSGSASGGVEAALAALESRAPSRIPQPRRRAPGSPTPASRTRTTRSNSFLRHTVTIADLSVYTVPKGAEEEVTLEHAKTDTIDDINSAKDETPKLSSEAKMKNDNRRSTLFAFESRPSAARGSSYANISPAPETAERENRSNGMTAHQEPTAVIPSKPIASKFTEMQVDVGPSYCDLEETPKARANLPPITIISPTPMKHDNVLKFKNGDEDTIMSAGLASGSGFSPEPVTQSIERFLWGNTTGNLASRPRFTSTGFPSPIPESPTIPMESRVASPSSIQSHKKENVVPVSLLRPVSPTQFQPQIHAPGQTIQPLLARPQPALSKSRSIAVLSSLTHPFRRSKSNLNLQARNSSASSSVSAFDPTTEEPVEYTPANPGPYLWGFRDVREWTGRFSAVENKIRNEFLALSLEDGPALEEYINSIGSYPELTKPRSDRCNDYSMNKSGACEANHFREPTPPEQAERRKFIADDEKLRAVKVMACLASLCKDEPAKKSFYLFQVQFARCQRRPDLMPEGSRMEKILGRVGSTFDAFKRKPSGAQGD